MTGFKDPNMGRPRLRPGYRARFQSSTSAEASDPGRVASPGASVDTGYIDFPEEMVEQIMKSFGVHLALPDTLCDDTTRVFSIVCRNRNSSTSDLATNEPKPQAHLPPQSTEYLKLCRVLEALRDLDSIARPGHIAALADDCGELHYTQLGFNDSLRREFPDWVGSRLPERLLTRFFDGDGQQHGQHVVMRWRKTPGAMFLLQLRASEPMDTLTPREREVVGSLSLGKSIKQAARSLGISPSTVDNLRNSAYSKLKVCNRAQLAIELNRCSFREEALARLSPLSKDEG